MIWTASARSFVKSIRKRLIQKRLPRIVTLRAFVPEGCRFEISTPVEIFRVEKFGGEKEFTEMILSELMPSDILFDIGTCVGMVAVHAARKGVRVVAFEPDPGYRQRLATNLRLNAIESVQVIDWAVSDTPGEATLYTDGAGGKSASLRKTGERGSTVVRTESLDHAIERGELPRPTVMKIDIEGAEILALKGMKTLLQSDLAPRTVFIETHPEFLPHFGSSESEVLTLLDSWGYVRTYKSPRAGQSHYVYKRAKP